MATSPFGSIDNPLKDSYGDLIQDSSNQGLIGFISNMLRFLTVIAGLFAFVNLILAGFTYISAGGDPKKVDEAWQKIYMSLIGLIVIVASYAIAAVVGQLLFNDPTAILTPQIYGPGIE